MSVFSKEDKIQILSDMIEINTENDNELEVCKYLKSLLSKYDIDSKILEVDDNRANLIAEIGDGSPKLGISGHMDVVDAGDHNEWKHDPFKLTEEDGKLYGRGTTDMKGGLAALVIA
ncbi:M20/M25/M40 family metallo-hydrolase, partial [Staphylococcus warneri]